MKTLNIIWNWKYRNHAILFLLGFGLATLIWLSIGNNEKYTETDLKRAEKVGEARIIETQLKDIKLIAKEYRIRDSINMEYIKELEIQLNKVNNGKKDKINSVDFYTDFELQKFFSDRYN